MQTKQQWDMNNKRWVRIIIINSNKLTHSLFLSQDQKPIVSRMNTALLSQWVVGFREKQQQQQQRTQLTSNVFICHSNGKKTPNVADDSRVPLRISIIKIFELSDRWARFAIF